MGEILEKLTSLEVFDHLVTKNLNILKVLKLYVVSGIAAFFEYHVLSSS